MIKNFNKDKLITNTYSIFLGAVLAIIIWGFVARPFVVYGASMYPTFNADENNILGDYLIIERTTKVNRTPERFDVVVSRRPDIRNVYILKRVIGLPNETINFKRNSVEIITKDNETIELQEDYLNDETIITYASEEITLGENEYFLMGDNRNNSLDSRSWGPVQKEDVVGRVYIRAYPFNRAGVLPGKKN